MQLAQAGYHILAFFSKTLTARISCILLQEHTTLIALSLEAEYLTKEALSIFLILSLKLEQSSSRH